VNQVPLATPAVDLATIRAHRDRIQRSQAASTTKAAALLTFHGLIIGFAVTQLGNLHGSSQQSVLHAVLVVAAIGTLLALVLLTLGDIPSTADYRALSRVAINTTATGRQRWRQKTLGEIVQADVDKKLTNAEPLEVWEVEDALATAESSWAARRGWILTGPYLTALFCAIGFAVAVSI
jgi:hypothetical protein